jgi:hypothetical protein
MLVLLENKGYLSRSQGLSRGLSVEMPPVLAPGDLAEQDYVALKALAGWQSTARDGELRMAAQVTVLGAKTELIETARARHQQVCHLESAVGFPDRGDVAVDPVTLAENHLLGAIPRCSRWELFVIDELVCNRVSRLISEYTSKTRPAMRGLLWRDEQFSERALARCQRWTLEVLDGLAGEDEFRELSFGARELAQSLYEAAQMIDSWCGAERSLISSAIDPDEVAQLV